MQSVYTIGSRTSGAGLALTTGRYYTPSGRMIQRPWDGAFDEYLTYSLRDQTADRSHDSAELRYTDARRKVYGGGGIEPDKFIAGPIEGFNPTRLRPHALGGADVCELCRSVHRRRRHADERREQDSEAHRPRLHGDRRDARRLPGIAEGAKDHGRRGELHEGRRSSSAR